MAKLEISSPGKPSTSETLESDLVVGRAAPADLVVVDAKISRRHCKIGRSATGWQLEDLGSSNGTRIAGKLVKSHPLRDGDRIEIGQSQLVFRASAAKPFAAPTRSGSTRERLGRKRRG
jgi:pSer/pThr/pTyr-binding forkhead associated (FHA) protein